MSPPFFALPVKREKVERKAGLGSVSAERPESRLPREAATMKTSVHDLFLSDQVSSIDRFGLMATSAVAPFLKAWWPGSPIPQEADIQRLRRWVETNVTGAMPPEYGWLPEFLNRICATWRFSSRNFINIHPSPVLP